jgi:Eukaryotic translation initiation factor 3 subunit 8 N-terminus
LQLLEWSLGLSSCALGYWQVLALLQEHPNITMDEAFEGSGERSVEPSPEEDVVVWGNLVAFVERLDDELFKSLQARRRRAFRLEPRGSRLNGGM